MRALAHGSVSAGRVSRAMDADLCAVASLVCMSSTAQDGWCNRRPGSLWLCVVFGGAALNQGQDVVVAAGVWEAELFVQRSHGCDVQIDGGPGQPAKAQVYCEVGYCAFGCRHMGYVVVLAEGCKLPYPRRVGCPGRLCQGL